MKMSFRVRTRSSFSIIDGIVVVDCFWYFIHIAMAPFSQELSLYAEVGLIQAVCHTRVEQKWSSDPSLTNKIVYHKF